jgi:hypothetical protein
VSAAGPADHGRSSYAAELDEQARRKRVRPMSSVDELDEFLADLDEFRHRHVA